MKRNTGLWIVQGLLAAMFLLAGVPKLVMSAAQMTAPGPIQVPVALIRFIGVCEVLASACRLSRSPQRLEDLSS